MLKSYQLLGLSCLLASTIAYGSAIDYEYTPIASEAYFQKKKPSELKISGYIDTSYNYLLRSNDFISDKHNRKFDIEPNGFTLQQAAITLSKQPKQGLGGLFTFIVGRDAITMAPPGSDPYFGLQNMGYVIRQLYLQYAQNSLTFMAGRFDNFAGEESYNTTKNTHFSLSILNQYAQPGALNGFRVISLPNENWTWVLGINNSTGSIENLASQNALECGFIYNSNTNYMFQIQNYFGPQYINSAHTYGPQSLRNVTDIVATLKVTDALSFAVNYDYDRQTKALLPSKNIGLALWQGISGYINYRWNEKWLTALRGEFFTDTQGYRTGVRQNWREATLTFEYSPKQHWKIRAETRQDFANSNSFVNKNGVGLGNTQRSYALEVFYYFG